MNHKLLCGLSLFLEYWLRPPTIATLFLVTMPLSQGKWSTCPLLKLCNIVGLVLAPYLGEGPVSFWKDCHVHLSPISTKTATVLCCIMTNSNRADVLNESGCGIK